MTRVKHLLWKKDASWRDVVVIAAAIVFVVALIGASWQ